MSEGAARREAERRLAGPGSSRLAVPFLVAANVLAYAAVGASGGGWLDVDGRTLIGWGSNFGPLTGGGEWWRLLTAAFLHGGLVHLAVNMVTLADVGRLCERLYGSSRFVVLYLVAALTGSAASVWWNPAVNSVGASGALFGVLGALLAFVLDRRNGVPPKLIRSHAATLAVFTVYGLASGYFSSGIDNTAHLGGLAGGALAGWALARPLDASRPVRDPVLRPAAGIAACVAAIVGLAALTPDTRAAWEHEERFLADIEWFRSEEEALNQEARRVFARARDAGASDAELRPDVAALAARWREAHQRLAGYEVEAPSRLHELHANMVRYLELRRRAMEALARAVESPAEAQSGLAEYTRLSREAEAVAARMGEGGNKARR